jgi:hypothetical protein
MFSGYLFKTFKTLKDEWGVKSMKLYVRDVRNKRWSYVDFKSDFRRFSKKVMTDHVQDITENYFKYFVSFENFISKMGIMNKNDKLILLSKEMIVDVIIDLMNIKEFRGCHVPEFRRELSNRNIIYEESNLIKWIKELKHDQRIHLDRVSANIVDNKKRIIILPNDIWIYGIHVVIEGDV